MTEQINAWEWYNNFYHEAVLKGDVRRQQLHELHQVIDAPHKVYEEVVPYIEQGLNLAQECHEPYWFVLFEYSRSHFLFNNYRIQEAIETATKLVVEVRKPKYQGCPLLGHCYFILLSAYTSYDPIGYAQEIEEAIRYVETYFQNDQQLLIYTAWRQTELHIGLENWHKAKDSAIEFQMRAKHGYPSVMTTILLCHIAYKLNDLSLLKTQLELGTSLLKHYSEPVLQVNLLLWQGVLLLLEKDDEAAKKVLNRVKEIQKQSTAPTSSPNVQTAEFYYDQNGSISDLTSLPQTDQFKNSYSPYYDTIRRLRAYYILNKQHFILRWMYIGIYSLHGINCYQWVRSQSIIIQLIILVLVGFVLNPLIHPKRRALRNLKAIIQKTRKPEFYYERIRMIEQKTGYVP